MTAADKTLPRVIKFEDIREGDLIEVTNVDSPDWLHRNRVSSVSDGGIRLHGEAVTLSPAVCDPDPRTFRLLEPPEANDNLPRVISFDDIRKGMTIERAWVFKGIRHRAEGVADHRPSEFRWCTADGGVIADRPDSDVTLWVLAEPPKPAQPTTHGTVIRCTLDGLQGAILVRTFGAWVGACDGDEANVTDLTRITDWTVVYDPSAPKTDNGLRERLERLVEDLTRNGGYHVGVKNDYQRGKGDGLLLAVEDLRHLLGSTETSAPETDNGLRERLEKLVGELDARPDIRTTYAWLATKVRNAITAVEAAPREED